MRTLLRILCVLSLASFVAACGDKQPTDEERAREALEDAMGTGIPTGLPGEPAGMPFGAAPIQLTDEIMEQYVSVLAEMKAAADSDMPPMALLGRYGWDLQRYMAVNAKVSQAVVSGFRGEMAEQMPAQLAALDEQISSVQQQIAEADASMKPVLERQLVSLQQARKGMAAQAALNSATSEIDRKNWEVLERWMPRIEAVTTGD